MVWKEAFGGGAFDDVGLEGALDEVVVAGALGDAVAWLAPGTWRGSLPRLKSVTFIPSDTPSLRNTRVPESCPSA
jgi:hypothetical protein